MRNYWKLFDVNGDCLEDKIPCQYDAIDLGCLYGGIKLKLDYLKREVSIEEKGME